MDYAELSAVFNVNPYYMEPPVEEQKEPEQKPMEVVQKIVESSPDVTCVDYEKHINQCHTCMYTQARKRSNLVNLLIIFALFWIIFKK